MEAMEAMRFLPGLRFTPTDLELVTEYLAKILQGKPIYPGLITDFNIYTTEPWNLPMIFEHGVGSEQYYFTERIFPRQQQGGGGGKGKRPARKAGGGTWKATGSEIDIKNEQGEVVGHLKNLCYVCDNQNGSSGYVMDEYILASQSPDDHELQKWAICRIKLNSTTEKRMRKGSKLIDGVKVEGCP